MESTNADWVMDESIALGPWVAEWCSMGDQKGTFHVDTLRMTIRHNIDVFVGAKQAQHITPWIILGIFRTQREAHDYIDHLEATRPTEPEERVTA